MTLILFLSTSLAHANVKTTVSGKVFEKGSNVSLEYATVSFTESGLQNPKFGGTTDENEEFSIEIETGTYTKSRIYRL